MSLLTYFTFLHQSFSFRFTVNKWLSPTKDDKQLFVELNHTPPPPLSPIRNK